MKGMSFVCDESLVFDLRVDSNKQWRNAIVGGVLLDYQTRCWWRKRFSAFPKKAVEYSHNQIISVLQSLANMGTIGQCHVIHLSVELEEARRCQADLLRPHLIADQPELLRESVRFHLENLEKMKPSTFAKTWTLLEVITKGVASYLKCVGRKRSQDQRGLDIIIDDQVDPSLPALYQFIWYFLNCRAKDGIFSFDAGIPKQMERCLVGDRETVNLTVLVNKIIVGKQGDKLDDKMAELRIADLICNLTNRRLQGKLSQDACSLLDEIVKDVCPRYFGDAPSVV